jgi:hypothetical protein
MIKETLTFRPFCPFSLSGYVLLTGTTWYVPGGVVVQGEQAFT